MTTEHVDIAIVGGGIAGLWVLRRALAAGRNAVLFERGQLGCEQTLASQGMIHGGLKYALSGTLTGASEAIADMPDRWRTCLAGQGEINLSALTPLSDTYYLFAARTTLGKLTSFFASKALRGRISAVDRPDFPSGFADMDGHLYELNDFVLDTPALLRALAEPARGRIFQADINAANCRRSEDGFTLEFGEHQLHVRQLVSCAGAGSQALLDALDVRSIRMQRRPLRQVVVHQKLAHPIYAHCLTNVARAEPRLTITTHGEFVYLGGRIATDGAARSDQEQLAFARKELDACLPWIDWSGAELSTLYIDRAEPATAGSLRPDEAYVAVDGAFVQCWPTKLTLTPDAGDKVMATLAPPGGDTAAPILPLPRAAVGTAPWQN